MPGPQQGLSPPGLSWAVLAILRVGFPCDGRARGQQPPSKSHLPLRRTWPGSSFGSCGNTMRWSPSFCQVSPHNPPLQPLSKRMEEQPQSCPPPQWEKKMKSPSGRQRRQSWRPWTSVESLLYPSPQAGPCQAAAAWGAPHFAPADVGLQGRWRGPEQHPGGKPLVSLNPSHASSTPPKQTGSSRRRPATPSYGATCLASSSHPSGKVR